MPGFSKYTPTFRRKESNEEFPVASYQTGEGSNVPEAQRYYQPQAGEQLPPPPPRQ